MGNPCAESPKIGQHEATRCQKRQVHWQQRPVLRYRNVAEFSFPVRQANPPPRICLVAAALQCMLSPVTQPSRPPPTVSSQRPPEKHVKALWGLAAARCSFTGYRELTITPPREKIQKNKLSPRISNLITSGLANSDLVESYIHSIARSDPKFPERLKAGFVNEYYRIRKSMSLGDELFLALLEFANAGTVDSRDKLQVSQFLHIFSRNVRCLNDDSAQQTS